MMSTTNTQNLGRRYRDVISIFIDHLSLQGLPLPLFRNQRPTADVRLHQGHHSDCSPIAAGAEKIGMGCLQYRRKKGMFARRFSREIAAVPGVVQLDRIPRIAQEVVAALASLAWNCRQLSGSYEKYSS